MSVIQWVTLIFLLVKYCISFVIYRFLSYFAPYLVRDLFSDEVRPINTYSNLMQLKSVQYAIC